MMLEIRKYSPARLEDCVAVLAEAFATNPLHRSAFGPERLDLNRMFFRIGLRRMFVGHSFMALRDEKVCGYVHFNRSPHCLPAPEEVPTAVASLLMPLGQALPQVIRWFARWCRLDPADPHVHLGPIAVAPALQRQGIGTALMERYVEHLEQEKLAGYLETDRSENVAFYKRFGFFVRCSEDLLGMPTWYMWRPAQP
jgi:ribosomal protein S18 acetylase RimI-like enzyme